LVYEWLTELNEDESTISSSGIGQLIDTAESMSKGRLWIGEDGGPRPWWHRLFGTQKRYVAPLFTLEWYSEAAALIFHDENWSEYRVLKTAECSYFPADVRMNITHGEVEAMPESECINKALAFKAIRESLENASRPDWLEYKFVE